MQFFDISQLSLRVHENRNYEAGQVRHLNIYKDVNSSASGQYGSRNFPKLVELISDVYKGKKVYFVDTRQDTHFEINNRPASLKRIVQNDDNTAMRGDDVIAKEKAISAFFVNKMITFIPKDQHGKPWEEFITQSAVVKDFIEHQQWEGRHTFIRFAVSEHGPLTNVQVDDFLALLNTIDSDGAWFHTNSIVGGAAAILLIVMKDMCQNATVDSLETILSRYEGAAKFLKEPEPDDENRQEKIKRSVFIIEFYTFARTRTTHQGWSDWKAKH